MFIFHSKYFLCDVLSQLFLQTLKPVIGLAIAFTTISIARAISFNVNVAFYSSGTVPATNSSPMRRTGPARRLVLIFIFAFWPYVSLLLACSVQSLWQCSPSCANFAMELLVGFVENIFLKPSAINRSFQSFETLTRPVSNNVFKISHILFLTSEGRVHPKAVPATESVVERRAIGFHRQIRRTQW